MLGPLDRLLDLHRRQREDRAQATYLQRQAEGMLDVTEEEFEPMAKVRRDAHPAHHPYPYPQPRPLTRTRTPDP